jgi:hypothetical protein
MPKWKCNYSTEKSTKMRFGKSKSGYTEAKHCIDMAATQVSSCIRKTAGNQKVSFPFFTWMEVSGNKKSTRISLNISPIFSHIVSKLVQALVIAYDEIFQAPAVKGHVLLPKPFLDPHSTHRTAPTGPTWISTCLANWKKHLRGQRFPSDDTVVAAVQKWLLHGWRRPADMECNYRGQPTRSSPSACSLGALTPLTITQGLELGQTLCDDLSSDKWKWYL